MGSCLLCLEINKDVLDCIKVNSTQWKELQIAKAIEKHFWALNTIQQSAWICSSCWREVDGFHKFYLRIGEAHVNFGKIKLEDLDMSVKCKDEFTPQFIITGIGNESDNFASCFREPEIIIDQAVQRDLIETELLIDQSIAQDFIVNKELTITENMGEVEFYNVPGTKGCKRKSPTNINSKDPLKDSRKIQRKKICKTKVVAEEKTTEANQIEESKVKKEPLDLNCCEAIRGYDNEISEINNKEFKDSTETQRVKEDSKNRRTNPKENDKFISEHLPEMVCDLCQVPFEDFPAMQKHFLESHKQSGYVVCCKKKFSVRTRLVDHLYCHLNPDHFKCKECGKTLSNRKKFYNHMLRTHNADRVAKRYSCEVCGKSFREASVLRIHKLTHLSEEEKKFPCNDCGKKYGSPYVLNQHRQSVHLKRFAKICYICGKSINSSAEFKVHMNRHEGVPLPVVNCDVCGLRLTSERGLKRHKESQHPVGGKQDHHCPICPKVSPTLKALKRHISTMHEKGYDYKCSICEKAFKRSEALRDHMATHSGTTLYTCPWCPKTFNSNGNMHAHRKKIHPKEWEESKLQKYSNNI